MDLQNDEGTAPQISLVVQYSSQMEEMLMLKSKRSVDVSPYGS